MRILLFVLSDQMIPPTKPLITQLSDTSVMLAWTVPANDGYRITFFKVQYKEITGDRHRSRWRTIDEDIQDNIRRYEVSGLKPGGMYRFRIAAVYSNNDNKLGANSDKFRLRKRSKQEAQRPVAGPVIVDARPIATDALIIRWQYLQVDGSPIEGFIIYYKPYGSNEEYQKQRVMGASQRNHIIRDLLAKTQYTIKMQCFNNVGKSDYSNSVVKSTLFE